MSEISPNDRILIRHLQKQGAKSVSELADLMDVTETAVRQRLTRLIAQGLITRVEEKLSRGRPVHKYSVTREGRASAGQSFSDLAAVVWDEVRAIEDETVRSQVVKGIAKRLAAKYQDEMDALQQKNGTVLSAQERADAIADFFESRGIPVTVNSGVSDDESDANEGADPFPILQLHSCPFPGLSESDALICEMEQSMFSELAGCDVELHRCDHKNQSECCTLHLEATHLEATHLEATPQSPADKTLINKEEATARTS